MRSGIPAPPDAETWGPRKADCHETSTCVTCHQAEQVASGLGLHGCEEGETFEDGLFYPGHGIVIQSQSAPRTQAMIVLMPTDHLAGSQQQNSSDSDSLIINLLGLIISLLVTLIVTTLAHNRGGTASSPG